MSSSYFSVCLSCLSCLSCNNNMIARVWDILKMNLKYFLPSVSSARNKHKCKLGKKLLSGWVRGKKWDLPPNPFLQVLSRVWWVLKSIRRLIDKPTGAQHQARAKTFMFRSEKSLKNLTIEFIFQYLTAPPPHIYIVQVRSSMGNYNTFSIGLRETPPIDWGLYNKYQWFIYWQGWRRGGGVCQGRGSFVEPSFGFFVSNLITYNISIYYRILVFLIRKIDV